jgi:single-strand DNA-binding protein
MSFNKFICLGNLTRDVETRFTQSGKGVASFGVALNHKWKTESGEQRDDVTFIDCEAWNRTGEVIAQYHRKGDPIMLQGHIKQDNWEDRESGQKRTKLKLVVESFCFAGNARGWNGGGKDNPTRAPSAGEAVRAAGGEQARRDAPAAAPAASETPEEDNVPF